MRHPEPNWITLEGGANARDVGGLPTVDGRLVRRGVLIRSANLQHLTRADLARFAELGVRRVVDLRTDVEVAAEGPGPMTGLPDVVIHHLSLLPETPSDSADDVPTANATMRLSDQPSVQASEDPADEPGRLLPWHDRDEPPALTGIPVADLYLSYLEQRPDSVVAALRAIADPVGATVVHCAAGKDRTGVVVAIALSLARVERSAIAADYAATEAQIGAIIELLARTETYQREVADPASVPPPRAEVIEAVLDNLESRPGGIRGWLAEHGWTAQDNEQLIAALIS